MEFLFQNPLIFLVLIFIISRLFKASGNTKNKNTQQRRTQTQTQTQNRPKKKSLFEELKQQFDDAMTEVTEETKHKAPQQQVKEVKEVYQNSRESVEDIRDIIQNEQEKQYAAFKSENVSVTHSGFDESELEQDFSGLKSASKDIIKERISLKKHLNRKGLKESIAMMEVLGPPRALRPYKSVHQERYSSK